jgi:hypothetical protein
MYSVILKYKWNNIPVTGINYREAKTSYGILGIRGTPSPEWPGF